MFACDRPPKRRTLAKSSCTSARALSPVEILSPVTMGALRAAAAVSPESALRRDVAVNQADARDTWPLIHCAIKLAHRRA